MTISVISITFNAVDCLEKTIESVIKQSGLDVEYIIIDGGSTDGTVDIIKSYGDYISYWVSEPDNGIYDAMNKGISVATGEVLAFLNAGDHYNDDCLKTVAERIVNNDLVIGNAYKTSNNERAGLFQYCPDEYEYKMPCCHQAVFTRKKVFDELGKYDTQYRICADYEWIKRVLHSKKYKVNWIEDVLVDYDISGISSSSHFLRNSEHIDIIMRYIEKSNATARCLKEICKQAYLRDAFMFFNNERDKIEKIIRLYFKDDADIVVWGTAYWGNELCNLLEEKNISIKAFVDSDKEKQDTLFHNKYMINDPSSITEKDRIIVAMEQKNDSIIRFLNEKCVKEEKVLFVRDIVDMIRAIFS